MIPWTIIGSLYGVMIVAADALKDMNPWPIIAPLSGIIFTFCGVLWYLIRTEIRNQILELHLTLANELTGFESRISALESEPVTVRKFRDIAALEKQA